MNALLQPSAPLPPFTNLSQLHVVEQLLRTQALTLRSSLRHSGQEAAEYVRVTKALIIVRGIEREQRFQRRFAERDITA